MLDAEPTAASGVVYVLHFDEPFGGKQHYTGWTRDLPRRMYDHLHNGSAGAALTRSVRQAGIGWTLAVTVEPASQRDERTVKTAGTRHLCPLCGGDPQAVLAPLVAGRITARPVVKPRRFGRPIVRGPA